jgi:prolyl-tRNA synthetase
MRLSRLPLNTFKEVPAEAEVISHQLMLRAGLIRRLASGLFTWMPIGLRVLRRVEQVVREEMDCAGAFELLMPTVQPAELWQETSRWDLYGDLLLRMRDRHEREFCFGPTHEEVITDIARRELKSYRQLPVNYYQIQTKFRDEIRPRFGVMRAREFVMKDAYSFHLDQDSLEQAYLAMAAAYSRIFTRLGLHFRPVEAASGEIGGSKSQEFHVLADSGEDAIAHCDAEQYAVNVELAPAPAPRTPRAAPSTEMTTVATPGIRSIDEVSEFLSAPPAQCVKTLIVEGENEQGAVALALRGDHELNAHKAESLPGVSQPLTLASPEKIEAVAGCPAGFVGPVGVDVPLFVDHSAATLADFICGANRVDAHHTGVNWGRDTAEPHPVDIRNVVEGDRSPGGGRLSIARGIEVGHIFQLGDKYSRSMNAVVLDQNGSEVTLIMGCYGIGVSRIVAAAIEQNHDQHGIIWPEPMSPFDVTLVMLNPKNSAEVTAAAETLYQDLTGAGLTVLFDDRPARPGVKFADADLLGVVHRLVVGEKGLAQGLVEYRHRRTGDEETVSLAKALDFTAERSRTKTGG